MTATAATVPPEYARFVEAARRADQLPPLPERLADGSVVDGIFITTKDASALLQRPEEGTLMPRTYKICSPHVPGVGHAAEARTASDQAATDERVDNVRVIPFTRSTFAPFPDAPATDAPRLVGAGFRTARAAVERMKLWDNGRTLRVKFIDGDPAVHTKVEAIAKEWAGIVNLGLDFVTSGASEIRVSFAEQGFSWSTVGTDALTVGSSRATMNYGWLEPTTSTREYQRVVRHEFGHALGMIHEHQNPAAVGQIPWDKPKVYAYYAQQGWNHGDVDNNIFDVYSEESTNHSTFDPTSIMQYAVPDSLTVGSYSIGWNTEFSAMDLDFMRRQYPQGAAGTPDVVVGGDRVHADLATAGEVDTYHFDVTNAATFIMTTDGPGDTVLTLQGPNDPGAILTWDDDAGRGLNARIVRKLFPGSYWLAVRHKDPTATGVYSVGVKERA